MNKEEAETVEKGGFTQKETTLLMLGVVMGVFGGFVSGYLVMWSNILLSEHPFFGAMLVTAVFFAFFTFMLVPLHIQQVRESKTYFSFAWFALKKYWKSLPLICLSVFAYAYCLHSGLL